MTLEEVKERIKSARVLLEQMDDAEWRADHSGELHALAARLDAEVTLLEHEVEAYACT